MTCDLMKRKKNIDVEDINQTCLKLTLTNTQYTS